MKAEAKYGMVEVTAPPQLTREEAAELLVLIATAIHAAGDISDPDAVQLLMGVSDAVKAFQRRNT